jgi:hypothetical protein
MFFFKKKPDPISQPWNHLTDSLSSLDLKLTHLEVDPIWPSWLGEFKDNLKDW